jgi:hypothetical protein
VTQLLSALATHTLALVVYPGLLTVAVFGAAMEIVWARISHGQFVLPDRLGPRPSAAFAAVALCSILATVQIAAPFNPVPSEERNLVIAAIALGFTVWPALTLGLELGAEPGLLLVIQCCWLVAILGPAVEPQSLRPQVLGAVLVPSLLPLKVASGFLYLLCLPALLRLWPVPTADERRSGPRLDLMRGLCWLPYCGLFTTLFLPPGGDDLGGVLRFFGVSFAVAAISLFAGALMGRRGAEIVRGLYARAVTPYAVLVLALVGVTALLVR